MNRSIETADLYLAKPKFEDWRSMYYNVWSQEETAKYMLWNVTKSEEDARLRMENIASARLQKSCGFTYTHSENRTDPRTGEGYILDFYKVVLGKVVLG